MSKKFILSILLINFVWLTSCSQIQNPKNYVEIDVLDKEPIGEQPIKARYKTQHAYGGWSCPDNLRGFPAINIQDLDKVPVVIGRLPTKEETQNGTSLMYFDTAHLKNVKPLDIKLPKLARCYSNYTKKNELIIVIQAAVIEKDTIVGFRYLNGGNGSAWLGEVAFINDDEIKELGSTPFISMNAEVKASRENIWKVITNPVYAESLDNMFDKYAFTKVTGEKKSNVQYKYAPESSVKTGTITADWKNLYLQIDYNFDGYHYTQKFLILENKENNTAQLQIVSGPYGHNFENQNTVWNDWLKKVKMLSEGMSTIEHSLPFKH